MNYQHTILSSFHAEGSDLPFSKGLSGAALFPLIHVTLYLGHDVLGALDGDGDSPEVGDLDLLLHLLRDHGMLLVHDGLHAALDPAGLLSQPGTGGEGPKIAVDVVLWPVQGAEPSVGGRELNEARGRGLVLWEGGETHVGGDERPVVGEPAA